MNNISMKLAIASVFKEKKKYMISFIMMILSFSVVMTFYNVLRNDEINQQKVKESLYGRWDICYENLSNQDKQSLKKTRQIDEMLQVEMTGILDDGSYMANYNKQFFDLASIKVQGRLPSKQNEILSKKGKINDVVTLNINGQDQQVTIVGLINDYDKNWVMIAYDYFSYERDMIKTHTFVSGETMSNSLGSYHGLHNHVVYMNYPLLSTPSQNVSYNYNGSIYMTEYGSSVDSDPSQTNYFNIILVFAIIGILVSSVYTMKDQKERFLLYKALGMTNKQLFVYIFYETIVLALVALIISILISVLLSYGILQIIYHYTKQGSFDYDFISMLPYVAVIFLTIVIAAFFACYIILIQSLESLIHKKERTIKKKYHKAKRMTVFHISCKEMKHHQNYIFSIAIISAFTLAMLSSLLSYPLQNLYQVEQSGMPYFYYRIYFPQKEKLDIPSFHDLSYQRFATATIKDSLKISDAATLVGYQKENVSQYQLIEGRMIENSDECVYKFKGCAIYSDEEDGDSSIIGYETYDGLSYPKIGEQIDVYDENENLFHSYKVVGLLFQDELESYDQRKFDEVHDSYYLVDEQTLPENEKYVYEGDSSKFLLPILEEKYNQMTIAIYYQETTFTMTTIESFIRDIVLVVVGVTFIILIFIVFVERLFQDLKLMRCLGMTKKQALQVNMYIYCYSMWFVVCYDFIYTTQSLIILFVYMSIFFIIFMSLTYYRLKADDSFLPTEVKRYY